MFKRFQKTSKTAIRQNSSDIVISPTQHKDILIVDDASINRYVLRKYVEMLRLPLSIDEANSGLQTLELIQSSDYKIILMDIKMPNIDGMETTKRLRNMNVKSYIIGVTGQVEQYSIDAAIKTGMDQCIGKPVEMSLLHKLILPILQTP